MPDVFISYSKVDKAHAEKLAADLKVFSLDVWWDADLYASQDYHDTIMEALNACTVAIVIWSPSALKSKWVRDEARRALAKNKLIPTYLPPFSIDSIPLGFGDIQTVDVNDRQAIFIALSKHGLPRRTGSHILAEGLIRASSVSKAKNDVILAEFSKLFAHAIKTVNQERSDDPNFTNEAKALHQAFHRTSILYPQFSHGWKRDLLHALQQAQHCQKEYLIFEALIDMLEEFIPQAIAHIPPPRREGDSS